MSDLIPEALEKARKMADDDYEHNGQYTREGNNMAFLLTYIQAADLVPRSELEALKVRLAQLDQPHGEKHGD